ncbi:MAG: hypothetical protein R3272_00395 [Candidatus Promineifilaceae bacterium]|nr:hypothetical protein [Candidatus Promineifilaceae bacterium]
MDDPFKKDAFDASYDDPFKDPLKENKGADVPDLYEEIEEESTWLGRLASKIPGFDGYIERSRRRAADQMLRDTIASRLSQTRLKLSNVHQDLSRDIILAIEYAEPLGRADSRLMGLIGKIKDAPQGYASFFDAVKVDADDLGRLYQFDAQMLAHADEIEADVNTLQQEVSNNGDVGGQIRRLDTAIQDANQIFGRRQEVLRGIAQRSD